MDREDEIKNSEEELKIQYNNFSDKEKQVLNEVLKVHANKAHIKNPDLVEKIIKIIKGQVKNGA